MSDALLPAGATPRIMGVLNVTPDSFSDGGRWLEPQHAIAQGQALAAAGADLIDVGGESTRPGSRRPPETQELDRVLPVVAALAGAGLTVSVDTMRASVARAAVQAGAAMVNDVSGGLADPQMAPAVAQLGVPFVAMHWRGHLGDPEVTPYYDDVVGEVCGELLARVDALIAAGIAREQLILDPGFGFSKDAKHNWELLAGLERVVQLGLPVLVGTSRKRFLGRLPQRDGPAESSTQMRRVRSSRPEGIDVAGWGDFSEQPSLPDQRDAATAATSLLGAQAGVWAVRVHEVSSTRDALAVWEMVSRVGQ